MWPCDPHSLLVPCAVLEVHQFSRDASVAEAWLLGQEPYLSSREIGQSVDEVEKLIKRHEAFEKSAATWDERFSALERLTTVSDLGVLNTMLCLLVWIPGFTVTSSPSQMILPAKAFFTVELSTDLSSSQTFILRKNRL